MLRRIVSRFSFGRPYADNKIMPSFVDRIFRGSGSAKAASPADLRHILGLKWTVNSKAEIEELKGLEYEFRTCGVPNLVLDKIEPGYKDIAFWFYVDNPKRAFKALAELDMISTRMKTLQVASADRTTMKFSVVYPK